MTKMNRLKKKAMEACDFRGHTMKGWQTGETKSLSVNTCTECCMMVAVRTRPMPNEIAIGGEAVALNCKNPALINKNRRN